MSDSFSLKADFFSSIINSRLSKLQTVKTGFLGVEKGKTKIEATWRNQRETKED